MNEPTERPNSVPEKEEFQPVGHTQNSVKRQRPQNKHLKPFKSRAELGGELDTRINVGGRPKILRQETAKWLAERDKIGKTNARKIVESVGTIAIGGGGRASARLSVLFLARPGSRLTALFLERRANPGRWQSAEEHFRDPTFLDENYP